MGVPVPGVGAPRGGGPAGGVGKGLDFLAGGFGAPAPAPAGRAAGGNGEPAFSAPAPLPGLDVGGFEGGRGPPGKGKRNEERGTTGDGILLSTIVSSSSSLPLSLPPVPAWLCVSSSLSASVTGGKPESERSSFAVTVKNGLFVAVSIESSSPGSDSLCCGLLFSRSVSAVSLCTGACAGGRACGGACVPGRAGDCVRACAGVCAVFPSVSVFSVSPLANASTEILCVPLVLVSVSSVCALLSSPSPSSFPFELDAGCGMCVGGRGPDPGGPAGGRGRPGGGPRWRRGPGGGGRPATDTRTDANTAIN